ncbi:MAG: hypothetical protein ACO280_10015 [Pseudohongiellaceae bacterium]|jgi:hypothetical protein
MVFHTLHRLARRLQPLQGAGLLLAAAASVGAMLLLLDAPRSHNLSLRLLLILALWGLLLVAFVRLFAAPVPVVLPALGWRDRIVLRLLRAWYLLLRFGFALVLLAISGLSIKLLLMA